jgi:hypothetical protein
LYLRHASLQHTYRLQPGAGFFEGAPTAELIASFSLPLALCLLFLGLLPAVVMMFIPTKKTGNPADTLFGG